MVCSPTMTRGNSVDGRMLCDKSDECGSPRIRYVLLYLRETSRFPLLLLLAVWLQKLLQGPQRCARLSPFCKKDILRHTTNIFNIEMVFGAKRGQSN
jgi:hypothetical protein